MARYEWWTVVGTRGLVFLGCFAFSTELAIRCTFWFINHQLKYCHGDTCMHVLLCCHFWHRCHFCTVYIRVFQISLSLHLSVSERLVDKGACCPEYCSMLISYCHILLKDIPECKSLPSFLSLPSFTTCALWQSVRCAHTLETWPVSPNKATSHWLQRESRCSDTA